MPEWKVGGRDVDGFITSWKCPECGYRIGPKYMLETCPNCHINLVTERKPHYNIRGEKDGLYHYELIAPGKLMRVTINDDEIFTKVTDVWTNDKEHKIRIRRADGIIWERSFSSFSITSYGKEEANNDC